MHTSKSKRMKAFSVRLDERTVGLIEVEAKAAGVSLAGWVRQAAEQRLAGSPALPASDSHDEVEKLAQRMDGCENAAKDIMAYLQTVIPSNEDQRRRMNEIRRGMDAIESVPTIDVGDL